MLDEQYSNNHSSSSIIDPRTTEPRLHQTFQNVFSKSIQGLQWSSFKDSITKTLFREMIVKDMIVRERSVE